MENKTIKATLIGILICLIISLILMANLSLKLIYAPNTTTSTNKIQLSPKEVIVLSDNRVAVLNKDENSTSRGEIIIYQYDKEKNTFVQIGKIILPLMDYISVHFQMLKDSC
jgi:hypothetical protein